MKQKQDRTLKDVYKLLLDESVRSNIRKASQDSIVSKGDAILPSPQETIKNIFLEIENYNEKYDKDPYTNFQSLELDPQGYVYHYKDWDRNIHPGKFYYQCGRDLFNICLDDITIRFDATHPEQLDEYYQGLLPKINVRFQTNEMKWIKKVVYLNKINVVSCPTNEKKFNERNYFVSFEWVYIDDLNVDSYIVGCHSRGIVWSEYEFSNGRNYYIENTNPTLVKKILNFVYSRFEIFKKTHNLSESVRSNINKADKNVVSKDADNVIYDFMNDDEAMEIIKNKFPDGNPLNLNDGSDEYDWGAGVFVPNSLETKKLLNAFVGCFEKHPEMRIKKSIIEAREWHKGFPIGLCCAREYDEEETNQYYLVISIRYIGTPWSGLFSYWSEYDIEMKSLFMEYISKAELMSLPNSSKDLENPNYDYYPKLVKFFGKEYETYFKHEYR